MSITGNIKILIGILKFLESSTTDEMVSILYNITKNIFFKSEYLRLLYISITNSNLSNDSIAFNDHPIEIGLTVKQVYRT